MDNPIKYHRHTIRLKEYDYSQKGMYFITICTYERKNILSKIVNTNNQTVGAHCMCPQDIIIKLSDIGKIVEQEILKTNQIRKNIEIKDYVIMPNHIHLIIFINELGTLQCAPTIEKFGMSSSNSIPEIVRVIKGSTTNKFKRKYRTNQKLWQRNYYEHIIRNEKELNSIIEYIEYNPFNWKTDTLYVE